MTVADCKDRKTEKKKQEILTCLTTVLATAQRVADSEEILKTLSEGLLTHGFQSIVLKCGEKRTAMKITTVSLPSQVKKSIEDRRGTSLVGAECSTERVPFCDKTGKGEVIICSSEQVLPVLLGVPLPLEDYTLPTGAAMVPVLKDSLLVVASDHLTEEDVPTFSAFKDVLENTISSMCLLKEMKEQREFLERIIRSVQEGILMEDSEGNITFVNPTVMKMLGYTEEDLIGHHHSEIVCPEFLDVVKEQSRKRPKGIESQYEACLQCKDGTSIPVIVSATPLFEEKKYAGTLSVFTDVSSLKQAEEEIRSLKEFSENIIHSMHEGIIIEDAKGVVTFVNPKLEELLEREKSELIGKHWKEFTAPEFISKVEEETARRVHNISGQYEAALLTKSGRQVPVMLGATPVFKADQFTGVISVCVDLTVVKEKEREIRQKNEDLRLLSVINHALNKGEDLSTILHIAVHEVQTIFAADFVAIMVVGEDKQSINSKTCVISPDVRSALKDSSGVRQDLFTVGKGSIVEDTVKRKKSHLLHDQDLKGIFKGTLPPEMITEIQRQTQITSAIVLPLLTEDKVTGVMVVGSQEELNQSDLNRLKSLSKHLALAIDHASLDETYEKTSSELQTSLLQQTMLRKLLERLYVVKNQEDVVDIAAEELEQLGYPLFGLALKEPEGKYMNVLRMQPKNVIEKVEKIVKGITGETPHLDRIPLSGDVLTEAGERRTPLVTDNILLHKDENVISLPWTTFIEAWVGKDLILQEKISQALGVKSAIFIPLSMEKEFVGALAVCSEDILEHHDLVTLETFGQIITEALERLQYSRALEKKTQDLEFSNRQLSLLQEVNNALNSTMDLDEILEILVRGISSVFGYETPSIYLLSDDRKCLVVKEFDMGSKLLNGITKLVKIDLKNYEIPLFDGSLLKQVIDEKKPLISNDIPRVLKDFTEKESLRRLAEIMYKLASSNWITALPLIARDEVVGILAFGSKEEVGREDIMALSGFLNQAALAINKAKLYEDLKEASQVKSEFIDIASHELRTPLTSIKLYLDMIERGRYGELSEELEEKIRLLQTREEKVENIIDNILVSSKVKKDKLELKKEKISLVGLVNDVVAELRFLLESKNLKIEVEGPYEFPLIEADRDGLWTVINALLDNAIKYSQEGTRITVKLYDLPKEVEIVVIDEGIGIQQKFLEKIFDEFFIVPSESEYVRQDGRAGLGLYIAKGYVEKHGGRIWVESVYGLGSTFHFALPK